MADPTGPDSGGFRRVARLDDLLSAAQAVGPAAVAIAGAEDRELLLAADEAARAGIARPLLVGNAGRIAGLAAEMGIDLDFIQAEVVDAAAWEATGAAEAHRAVDLVRKGRADLLMKGKVDTAELLHAVLEREAGLRVGSLLSHVVLLEVPGFDRLLYVTDGGVVLTPTLEQKLQIVRNAISTAHALGLAEPKVALLSASELVNPDLPSAVDAAVLAKMADRGQITGALVDGPLGLDNAVLASAAETKGVRGPVAGRADILVAPGVEAGNLMAKAITFLAGGRMAGVVVGARVPVVIASRADPHQTKLLSMALGVVLAGRTGCISQSPLPSAEGAHQ